MKWLTGKSCAGPSLMNGNFNSWFQFWNKGKQNGKVPRRSRTVFEAKRLSKPWLSVFSTSCGNFQGHLGLFNDIRPNDCVMRNSITLSALYRSWSWGRSPGSIASFSSSYWHLNWSFKLASFELWVVVYKHCLFYVCWPLFYSDMKWNTRFIVPSNEKTFILEKVQWWIIFHQ